MYMKNGVNIVDEGAPGTAALLMYLHNMYQPGGGGGGGG